jgi:hypothetical protein
MNAQVPRPPLAVPKFTDAMPFNKIHVSLLLAFSSLSMPGC